MKNFFYEEKFYSSVVHEIRNLINEEVILTNEEGLIVASTDTNRLHHFHEGAYLSMQKKEKMIMTEELTLHLEGVHPGVVLPVIIENKPLGVIGITGDPQVVEPYAMLVQKVTELFIQDSAIRNNQERKARELEFFVFDWLSNKGNKNQLIERSHFFNINMQKYRQVVVIETNDSALNLSLKEVNFLRAIWDQRGDTIFIRWGQEKILMLITQINKPRLKQKLEMFLNEIKGSLNLNAIAGVGQLVNSKDLYLSFDQANRACEVTSVNRFVVFEEDLKFDILQHELNEETKQKFIKRTIRPLLQEEVLLETLDCWFQNNMFKQRTAKKLHIHINTLQYRLKRITEVTDLHLNDIDHLVTLYLSYRFLHE
ncbi:sugar diacid recognition domain-containing protein [Virgibacillus siamensis]|uniref:Sugar diacid recognition domain-containing protein n=1 Tax=Virgibacillus siamensis TaxID=480071 RepID=A0ABP3RH33_9BACI